MSAYLDLDDVAATSPLAQKELAALRAEHEFYRAVRTAREEYGWFFLHFSTRVIDALAVCDEKLARLECKKADSPIADQEEK